MDQANRIEDCADINIGEAANRNHHQPTRPHELSGLATTVAV
jgi:hypothetical protein